MEELESVKYLILQEKFSQNTEKMAKEHKKKKRNQEGFSRRHNLCVVGIPKTKDKANEYETII